MKYLYCIINSNSFSNYLGDSLDVKGLEEKNVYAIGYKDISCLMSDTACGHFPLYREHITAHQRPIEEAMKHHDVLPFSFDTIADTEERVKEEVLKERYDEFQKLFQKFKNKTEIGLKALWKDMKLVFKEITKKSPEIQRLKKTGRLTYQKQIAAGELVAKLLDWKRKEDAKRITEAVNDLVQDSKELQLVGEPMVLNAAFLINKGEENEFARKTEILSYNFPNIQLRCYGPFPLYNFVSLKIHLA